MTPPDAARAAVEALVRSWSDGTGGDDVIVDQILAFAAAQRAEGALEEAAKHADCCVDREERLTPAAQAVLEAATLWEIARKTAAMTRAGHIATDADSMLLDAIRRYRESQSA